MKQTKCIDDCKCVYCGKKFDGQRATNGDLDAISVKCPHCEKPMWVSMSVEYMCTAMTEEEMEDDE